MELRPETLLGALVDFAYTLRFEDLPKSVIEKAKRHFIDSVGCALGATWDPVIRNVRENMRKNRRDRLRGGGYILGLPDMAFSPKDAVWTNTAHIRWLDYNDTYLSPLEPAHPSDGIGVPLAFIGNPRLSGKDLILTTVLSNEIQCSFCDAATLRGRGWDHTYYASAASSLVAARIMGLSKTEMRHALSFALLWAPLRNPREGELSCAKGLMAADAIMHGMYAAEKSAMGLTAPSRVIEGKFGVMEQITGPPDPAAFEKLGQRWHIAKTHLKKWPVEYHAQAAVEAALSIRKKIPDPRRIQRIDIWSYEACRSIIGDQDKRTPENKETADHSLFWVLASSLLYGPLTLDHYAKERYRDQDIQRIISAMSEVKVAPEYTRAYKNPRRPGFPLRLRVHTTDGKHITEEIKFPRGHFANPMNDEEITEKFISLANIAGIDPRERDFLLTALRYLEEVDATTLAWAFNRVQF